MFVPYSTVMLALEQQKNKGLFMIINAERMRIEEDEDNKLWVIDFRDEDQGLRGRIEIPSDIVKMDTITDFKVEILSKPLSEENTNLNDALIVFNATSFRTKPRDEENIYSFSSGGLLLRLFSGTPIKELKGHIREYIIIVH